MSASPCEHTACMHVADCYLCMPVLCAFGRRCCFAAQPLVAYYFLARYGAFTRKCLDDVVHRYAGLKREDEDVVRRRAEGAVGGKASA